MRWTIYLPLLIILFSGCNFQEREAAVQKREAELAQKEQELLVKENNLQLKEAELVKREQQLKPALQPDSLVQPPAASPIDSALIGTWNARMVNTETTCPGAAIGDTKTEIWELSYQNGLVVAKAMTGEKLTRTYIGNFKNNILELSEDIAPSASAPATKMIVRLTLLNPASMAGQREIIRAGDCRIVYDLQLNKQ